MDVAAGRIYGKVTEQGQKTRKGFLEFMDDLLRELPSAEEYHIIQDNHGIHKNLGIRLQQHKNVFFHYTPTNASWVNMVEIWFGILTRKSLHGKSFSSTKELCAHIKAFIAAYNQNPVPFVWRKREVRGTVVRKCYELMQLDINTSL
ncbi:MAG: transposase [Holophagaceae bacterium]|nr:transposase [Holophagaceae bacterium]